MMQGCHRPFGPFGLPPIETKVKCHAKEISTAESVVPFHHESTALEGHPDPVMLSMVLGIFKHLLQRVDIDVLRQFLLLSFFLSAPE